MQSWVTAVNHRQRLTINTEQGAEHTLETHTRRGKRPLLNTGTFLFLSRFRVKVHETTFVFLTLFISMIDDRHSRQIIHQLQERKRVLNYGDESKISNTHYRRSGTIERPEQNTTFSQNWARLTRLLSFHDL
jgi:hypothetical protein